MQENDVAIIVNVCLSVKQSFGLAMHCLLSVRCTCVLGSSLGALEVSVSVTASDMQSSVLQTSSRSHGENTRRGH